MTGPQLDPCVLVVDDEAAIRDPLARYLTVMGYQAVTAADGEQALAQLRTHPVAALLLDVRMPGPSGLDVLPRAIAHDPDLAVIMLTGVGDPSIAIQCLKLGAADYLIKPVDLEELGLALAYALRKRQLEVERRELEGWLAREVARKTQELEEQGQRMEAMSLSVLAALVEVLEPAGPLGRTHSVRVANLAAHIAARLGLEADQIETILLAGRLHDIGRLALREERLKRASGVGPAELVGATRDSEMAARIFEPMRRHPQVREIVQLQHERFDGQGPAGLGGDAIPLGARIVAVANLYDELTAPAEPRAGLSHRDALANLRGLAGTMLDPAVLDALERVVAESER